MNEYDTCIKDKKWYRDYLLKYLSYEKLRVLFVGNKANIYSISNFSYEHENFSVDMCQSISNVYCEHQYSGANNFSFDYDLIVMVFFHRENQSTVKHQSDYFKQLASLISKDQKKRVTVAFFSSLSPNECIFHSINSSGDIINQISDMPDAYPNIFDYIGKVLFVHNRYVEIDREKKENVFKYVKSLDGLK